MLTKTMDFYWAQHVRNCAYLLNYSQGCQNVPIQTLKQIHHNQGPMCNTYHTLLASNQLAFH